MEVFLVKTLSGLKPAAESDADLIKNMTLNEVYKAKVTMPRNVGHHRKYFALLQLVLDNIPDDFYLSTADGQKDYIKTVDDLLFHIKCQTGHMEKRVSLGGKLLYVPKSISFGKMDQAEFNKFYSDSLDVICKFFLTGTDKGELAAEVEMFF